jgi:hypothetical protein
VELSRIASNIKPEELAMTKGVLLPVLFGPGDPLLAVGIIIPIWSLAAQAKESAHSCSRPWKMSSAIKVTRRSIPPVRQQAIARRRLRLGSF